MRTIITSLAYRVDRALVKFIAARDGSIRWSAIEYLPITMSGGSMIGGLLVTDAAGMLTIHGVDFAVDGTPFGYGELTSIFGGRPDDEP